MEVDFAVPARYVEYAFDGNLTIAGAGTRVCFSQPLPPQQAQFASGNAPAGTPITLFVALGLSFSRAEAAAPHTLQIAATGPSGATVFDTGASPLPIRDDPNAPAGAVMMFLTPVLCQFAPLVFGRHELTIAIDGVRAKSLDFLVAAPPQMEAQ